MKKTDMGHRLVPSLLVRDMDETIAFYETLGFEVCGSQIEGESRDWVEVRRDSVVMQFHSKPPGGTPPEPVCSGTFYLYPDGVLELADELRGKVSFAWGPEVMDYGMREFAVQDPNGYFIAFTEPA